MAQCYCIFFDSVGKKPCTFSEQPLSTVSGLDFTPLVFMHAKIIAAHLSAAGLLSNCLDCPFHFFSPGSTTSVKVRAFATKLVSLEFCKTFSLITACVHIYDTPLMWKMKDKCADFVLNCLYSLLENLQLLSHQKLLVFVQNSHVFVTELCRANFLK